MENTSSPLSLVMNSSEHKYLTLLPECSSLPPEAYLFNPAREDRFFICGENYIQRLIFYGDQKWEEWEQAHIDSFYQYLTQNNLTLPEGQIIEDFHNVYRTREEEVLRNLQAAQFKHKATFTNINKNYEWKNILFPIKLVGRSAQIINKGFCYVGGRDRNFRPLMIIKGRVFAYLNPCPTVEEGMACCTFVMEYIKSHYFIPGKVENWIICVDFGQLGLSQLPFNALKAMIITLQSQYRCIAARLFIINVSTAFHVIWRGLQVFLEEHTKKKITITKEMTCPELRALFAPDQLEKKYGGEAPDVTDPVWPPKLFSSECQHDEDKQLKPEQLEDQQEEELYQNLINTPQKELDERRQIRRRIQI